MNELPYAEHVYQFKVRRLLADVFRALAGLASREGLTAAECAAVRTDPRMQALMRGLDTLILKHAAYETIYAAAREQVTRPYLKRLREVVAARGAGQERVA